MSFMIMEYVPQKSSIVMDIMGSTVPKNLSNLRMIGDKTFETVEEAQEWINNTLTKITQVEANNEYGRIVGAPEIYDKSIVDGQLDEGLPLVSKNVFIIPILEYMVVKGFPNR